MKAFMRMVGRALSIEEAHRVAQQYEAQGYETDIIENKQGALAMFEVWAGKKPEIFGAGGKSISRNIKSD